MRPNTQHRKLAGIMFTEMVGLGQKQSSLAIRCSEALTFAEAVVVTVSSKLWQAERGECHADERTSV